VPVRTVAPSTLASAYQSLYPAEVSSLAAHTEAAREWIAQLEANPVGTIGHLGQSWKVTQAYFKALGLPVPKTKEMALFLLTHPDLEKQKTELVYVRASTPDGDNVDLIVRAISREHAEVSWRDHFDGWDLPDRPYSITVLPQSGPPGAIPWEALAPDADQDTQQEMESAAPFV
jgi:hypothetical protein